jgi:dipeptidyl aminopeptidase/acylaminoacyl peptidase
MALSSKIGGARVKLPVVVSLVSLVIATASYCSPQTSSGPNHPSPVIVARHPVELSQSANDADLLKKVRVEAITYMSDGLRINGYIALPQGPGPFPCLIVNRGGNPNLGTWTDERAVETLGRYAGWGYVVVASQYRGSAGSEGRDEYGGADVDDVLNLIPVLESVGVADVNRIGITGASRGGIMTYAALTRTDKIRAAIILSGMSDLEETRRSRPDFAKRWTDMMPDFANDKTGALKRRSAIQWIDKLPAGVPLLLIHGTADGNVSPVQALDMAKALYDAKRPFRLVIYEGGGHGVPEFSAGRDTQIHEWLDNYVRDGKKWPDLNPRTVTRPDANRAQ